MHSQIDFMNIQPMGIYHPLFDIIQTIGKYHLRIKPICRPVIAYLPHIKHRIGQSPAWLGIDPLLPVPVSGFRQDTPQSGIPAKSLSHRSRYGFVPVAKFTKQIPRTDGVRIIFGPTEYRIQVNNKRGLRILPLNLACQVLNASFHIAPIFK